MSSKTLGWILAAAVAGVVPSLARADTVTTSMNFDEATLAVGDNVGTFYAGYLWTNAQVYFPDPSLSSPFYAPPSSANVVINGAAQTCGSGCSLTLASTLPGYWITGFDVSGMAIGNGNLTAIASDGTQLSIDVLDVVSPTTDPNCPSGTAAGWTCHSGTSGFTFSIDQHVTSITFNAAAGLAGIDSLSVTQSRPDTTVPEPASLALVAVGLVGAAFRRRQRNA